MGNPDRLCTRWQAMGQINLMLEPVGDYDYLLPRTKTDEHGQYRFPDVPGGAWSVFVRG